MFHVQPRGGDGRVAGVSTPADARSPEEITVPVEGGELAALYWSADAPGAPLVVLVHGITGNAAVWGPVAAAVLAHGAVRSATVRVSKLDVIEGIVGIEIRRERQG